MNILSGVQHAIGLTATAVAKQNRQQKGKHKTECRILNLLLTQQQKRCHLTLV
jgi:hypothetical protein